MLSSFRAPGIAGSVAVVVGAPRDDGALEAASARVTLSKLTGSVAPGKAASNSWRVLGNGPQIRHQRGGVAVHLDRVGERRVHLAFDSSRRARPRTGARGRRRSTASARCAGCGSAPRDRARSGRCRRRRWTDVRPSDMPQTSLWHVAHATWRSDDRSGFVEQQQPEPGLGVGRGIVGRRRRVADERTRPRQRRPAVVDRRRQLRGPAAAAGHQNRGDGCLELHR